MLSLYLQEIWSTNTIWATDLVIYRKLSCSWAQENIYICAYLCMDKCAFFPQCCSRHLTGALEFPELLEFTPLLPPLSPTHTQSLSCCALQVFPYGSSADPATAPTPPPLQGIDQSKGKCTSNKAHRCTYSMWSIMGDGWLGGSVEHKSSATIDQLL